MSTIKLIVGLANPGPQYQDTRHNAGAWFVEQLARSFNIPLNDDTKHFGLLGRGLINQHDVRLLIPTTFMNLSGKSVASVANFFKIDVDEILVAHDELDIKPGEIRLKKGGGHGGHNGLRDIISQMANQRDFYRLRVGIGHPGDKSKVTGFVLGKPSNTERERIDDAVYEAVRSIDDIISGRFDKAMQYLHSLKIGQSN
ncbi:aminoacyl-tRNA hydrolase [Pleionea litopenaei]|uniref:Peptidyl-tRNA hydrolase n=1 Tax=Pleionea litopenaei TaxID=3070815 RepID=A0AA51X697_9GAMM|nr:aminoacyl-tRNA hydrolase [Pleionea sp. HL-JVS1]WMS87067.1 aminoacyl-tRNA hydrolase [Pleionea sp. HL-JVS1]